MFAAVSRLPNIYISRYLDIYDAVSGCEAGDLLRVTCCSADPDQAHQAAMTHVPWPATAFLRRQGASTSGTAETVGQFLFALISTC